MKHQFNYEIKNKKYKIIVLQKDNCPNYHGLWVIILLLIENLQNKNVARLYKTGNNKWVPVNWTLPNEKLGVTGNVIFRRPFLQWSGAWMSIFWNRLQAMSHRQKECRQLGKGATQRTTYNEITNSSLMTWALTPTGQILERVTRVPYE